MDQDDKVLAYLQGHMSEQDRGAFEREIAGSPELAAEIAALRAAQSVMADGAPDMPADGWARLSSAIAASEQPPANTNRPMRLTLVQAACVAIAAVIGWHFVEPAVFQQDAETFTPASTDQDIAALQIVFAQSASMGEIAAILAEVDATVADGPGAMGIFRLTFADAAARDQAFAALRARQDLVEEVLVD